MANRCYEPEGERRRRARELLDETEELLRVSAVRNLTPSEWSLFDQKMGEAEEALGIPPLDLPSPAEIALNLAKIKTREEYREWLRTGKAPD